MSKVIKLLFRFFIRIFIIPLIFSWFFMVVIDVIVFTPLIYLFYGYNSEYYFKLTDKYDKFIWQIIKNDKTK